MLVVPGWMGLIFTMLSLDHSLCAELVNITEITDGLFDSEILFVPSERTYYAIKIPRSRSRV